MLKPAPLSPYAKAVEAFEMVELTYEDGRTDHAKAMLRQWFVDHNLNADVALMREAQVMRARLGMRNVPAKLRRHYR
jgi:hypothetical protein